MRVLLAVDGSEHSLAAVEEAARTPWPQGTVLKIVSVADLPSPTTPFDVPLLYGSSEDWERLLEERSLANATRARERFGEIAGPRTEVMVRTLKEDPKAAILDEAERWDADLIIVGTHGYSAMKRLLLGSVSRAVLSHANCSVQIVRRRATQNGSSSVRKILLAVDGSDFSNAAVEEIATRPWPGGSEVHVISVVHLPVIPITEAPALTESYYAQTEKAGREHAESAISLAVSRLHQSNSERETPLTVTSEVIVGHVEETILDTAKAWGADLVVLGSHGHRGLTRFLLGSVSQSVALHAHCSVQVVPKRYAKG